MRKMYILMATIAMLAFGVNGIQAQQMPSASDMEQSGEDRPVITLTVAADDTLIVQPLAVSVGDLKGGDLYGADDSRIGSIERVLIDDSGKAVAITAEVGSFLGLGQTEIVVLLDQVELKNQRDLSIAMSRQQIEDLPKVMDDPAHH
jgi:hypothetical protein